MIHGTEMGLMKNLEETKKDSDGGRKGHSTKTFAHDAALVVGSRKEGLGDLGSTEEFLWG